MLSLGGDAAASLRLDGWQATRILAQSFPSGEFYGGVSNVDEETISVVVERRAGQKDDDSRDNVPGCSCSEETPEIECPFDLDVWGQISTCKCCKACRAKCYEEIGGPLS